MNHVMSVDTEELRESARHMRGMMTDLDAVGYRTKMLWDRLDSGWQFFSSGTAEAGYANLRHEISFAASALYHCAWSLEAAVYLIEEADRAVVSLYD